MPPARRALVLGATGLVGGHLVHQLLDDPHFTSVAVLARRESADQHPKLDWQVADFKNLGTHAELFSADAVFSCLGTTIKQAGSAEAFRNVDHGLNLEAARLTAQAGPGQFYLVSSTGANPASRWLYYRVKGELEADLEGLPLRGIHIFRPNLLLGHRQDRRIMELISKVALAALKPLLAGPLRRYRPIEAAVVASAMVWMAADGSPGYHLYPSREIEALGAAANLSSRV